MKVSEIKVGAPGKYPNGTILFNVTFYPTDVDSDKKKVAVWACYNNSIPQSRSWVRVTGWKNAEAYKETLEHCFNSILDNPTGNSPGHIFCPVHAAHE